MRLYRIHASSPDVHTPGLPFADVWMPDSCDPDDRVWRARIIAAAAVKLRSITDKLVTRLGILPRIEYAITEMPTGARRSEPLVVLKRGVRV